MQLTSRTDVINLLSGITSVQPAIAHCWRTKSLRDDRARGWPIVAALFGEERGRLLKP